MSKDDIISRKAVELFRKAHQRHVFWDRLFTAFAVADVLFLFYLMHLDGVI